MAGISVRMAHRPVFVADVEQAGLDVPAALPAEQLALVRIIQTSDLWVLERIEQWQAAYRMAVQDGAAVVAEVRLYPQETGARPGEWSGVYRGLSAKVPRGGITARLLRRVRIGAHVLEGRHVLFDLDRTARKKGQRSALRDILKGYGLVQASPPVAKRAGGRKPIRDLNRIATVYRAALQRGSRRPVRDVAESLGLDPKAASNAVFEARSRGLLPATSRGRMRGA